MFVEIPCTCASRGSMPKPTIRASRPLEFSLQAKSYPYWHGAIGKGATVNIWGIWGKAQEMPRASKQNRGREGS